MRTTFHRYHDSWNHQLSQLISEFDQLYSAPPSDTSTTDDIRRHVDKVVSHYESYYHVKSDTARSEVMLLFSAPWATSLERALSWVAGFRPTTLFHLVYTETSIRFESRVAGILQGKQIGDMSDLSQAQLSRVSELQCSAVKEENNIMEKFGAWQVSVASGDAEWAGLYRASGHDGLDYMLRKLGEIVVRADELGVRALKCVVELLTPRQAMEFLVAFSQLQFGIHGWGAYQDSLRDT